ncbi:UNVERIFIED_CONTAM: Peptidase M13, partial [Siphonaria sp. JEL0065]
MNNAFEIGDDDDDIASQQPRSAQTLPSNTQQQNPTNPDHESPTDTDKLLTHYRKESSESNDSAGKRSIKKSVTISTDRPKVYDLEANSPTSSPGAHKLPMLNTRQLLFILMGVCGVILAFLIFGTVSSPHQQSWSQLCTTRDCISSANGLFTGMDESLDPCDDFYAFACNNWIENNPIPDFSLGISTFSKMVAKNTKILKSIVTSDYKPDLSLDPSDAALDKSAFTNLQFVYRSCANRTIIKARGLTPLRGYLHQYQLENFPLESTSNPGKVDASKFAIALAASHDIGVFPLFATYVDMDLLNPDQYTLAIVQSGVSAPAPYYNDTDFQSYLSNVMSFYIGQVMGASYADTNLIHGLIQFEAKLAKYFYSDTLLYEEDPMLTYHPVPLKSLSMKNLNLQTYFKTRMPFYDRLDKTVTADLTTKNYYINIDATLAATSPQVLELYLLWHQLSDYLEFVEPEQLMPIEGDNLEKPDIVNQITMKPFDNYLSQYCMHGADQILGDVLAKAFVQRQFPESSRKAAQDLVANVKASFVDKLHTITWLDDPTRTLALEKVDAIVAKIGYDDSIMNPQMIANKYPFTLDDRQFFENVMKGERNLIRLNLEKITGPVDRTEWFMSPSTVNAYYNPSWNEIVFPAAILMDPMYNANRPEYMNYGVIGLIIGHEIIHAFDNMGRLFDASGKLNDWWTKQSEDAFNSKAQCIVDQYSSYKVTDSYGKTHHIDGQLSNGENIADNGGLSISLKSWKTVANSNGGGNNMILPGLNNYTHEQLFFLSYGQVWCSNETPQLVASRLSDPHSPPRFRVNGPMQNSAEFSRVFNCPANSNMNPKN